MHLARGHLRNAADLCKSFGGFLLGAVLPDERSAGCLAMHAAILILLGIGSPAVSEWFVMLPSAA